MGFRLLISNIGRLADNIIELLSVARYHFQMYSKVVCCDTKLCATAFRQIVCMNEE